MIIFTREQAKLILRLIKNDIECSAFDVPDFTDADELQFYFERAVLRERVLNVINLSEGGA